MNLINHISMTAEEIVIEIENLSPADQERLNVHCALKISDLRYLHLAHPDRGMVEKACLHYLGDEAQRWFSRCKNDQVELNIRL
jgi:hypothetical protein